MKPYLHKLVIIAIFASSYFTTKNLNAQCGANFTSAQINFDMHYFETTSLPTSPLYFAFGKNSMRFAWSGGSNNIFEGTNENHTAVSGNDIQFSVRNGADTLEFKDEVRNLSFKIHDIDVRQAVTITATNAIGLPALSTATRVSGTSLTALTGAIPSISQTVTSSNTSVSNNSQNGTITVTVSGNVKKIVLEFTKSTSGTDPIWISNITACNNNLTTGIFASNYQSVSLPEIGQPSYMMASYGDSIVVVDITNNTVELLHEVGNDNLIDTLFAPAINSLAYDPYNLIVYYCDNARTTRNKSVFKYNVLTGVKSTFIEDVSTFGIQLFGNGMGSGGAGFYDGALYLGQDMTNTSGTTEPVSVYRIDIDATTGNPSTAVRVWSKLGYDGNNSVYDWADFIINDGVLYNFNSASSRAANTGIEHINLNSNTITNGYSLSSTIINGSQSGINYLGQILHVRTNTYALYNTSTGTIGSNTAYSGTGSRALTDAAESFKFPYDFGDAPVGYGIAFHKFRTTPNLMIGGTVDYEQFNSSNSTADADNFKNTGSVNDEDGVTIFPTLVATNTTYTVNVRTTNSTGAAATLYGFIDFNRDGDFDDPGERSLASNVPNGTTISTPIAVNFVGLTAGSIGSSFIRFRIASNAAEAANRSGYAATGEVEDYPIPIIASSLPVELVSFKAEALENNTSLLSWSTASEFNNDYFEVQRKVGNTWIVLGKVAGTGFSNSLNSYSFIDETPEDGINYYQLKQVDFDGKTDYSPIISVTFNQNQKIKTPTFVVESIYPNPTTDEVWIKTNTEIDQNNLLDIEVFNSYGEKLKNLKLEEQSQKIDLSQFNSGIYIIKIGNQIFRIIKK